MIRKNRHIDEVKKHEIIERIREAERASRAALVALSEIKKAVIRHMPEVGQADSQEGFPIGVGATFDPVGEVAHSEQGVGATAGIRPAEEVVVPLLGGEEKSGAAAAMPSLHDLLGEEADGTAPPQGEGISERPSYVRVGSPPLPPLDTRQPKAGKMDGGA